MRQSGTGTAYTCHTVNTSNQRQYIFGMKAWVGVRIYSEARIWFDNTEIQYGTVRYEMFVLVNELPVL